MLPSPSECFRVLAIPSESFWQGDARELTYAEVSLLHRPAAFASFLGRADLRGVPSVQVTSSPVPAPDCF